MPYQFLTFGEAKTALAERLGDPNKIFWTDRELGLLITGALRTFGLLSGFWRQRGVFQTSPGQASYDITELLPDLLGYTVTDYDVIEALQYLLLETPAAASQSTWLGTEMYTLDDLSNAVERRRNQFLLDTGVRLTRKVINGPAPQVSRLELDDHTIDVRRLAWLGAAPFNYYTLLRLEDEPSLSNWQRSWNISPDTPYAWSWLGPPPLQLQLAPPPISDGQLDIVTVESGPDFTGSSPTTLGIPDDLTWVVKWGALADLLSKDGVTRDPVRAAFAQKTYDMGVELARLMPVVINVEIQGLSLTPTVLAEVDSAVPNWQNQTGFPTDVAVQGANLAWLYPVPDDVYSITLDVVRRAIIPVQDTDYLQIGRELVDMILDYAEHVGMFKCAGTEWHATSVNAQNFLEQALAFNKSIAASSRYIGTARDNSIREMDYRPRMLKADGVGALLGSRDIQGGGGA